MKRFFVVTFGAAALLLAAAGGAPAQTYDSGSTGANGVFTLPNATCPTQGICIMDVPDSGIFGNFTTFTVPGGWTLKFKRNATNTPVTILASGNVTITGTIDLNGAGGAGGSPSQTTLGNTGGVGGPGGFDGGSGANGIVSTTGGTGGGPGAGAGGTVVSGTARGGGGAGYGLAGGAAASGGGAGGPAYGVATLLPPIGGSGGGGGAANFGASGGGGGGGGGALIIASSGTISVTGSIQAKGGAGGWVSVNPGGAGSGGAIRLAATTIAGTGNVDVSPAAGQSGGGTGSIGRIRVEGYNITATYGLVGTKASIVNTPNASTLANAPSLRITTIAGITTPTSPGGIISRPDVVLPISTTNPVSITITGAQIPLGTTVLVSVRGQAGSATSVTSPGLSGTLESSSANVSLTVPTDQPAVISATATFERVAWGGGRPVYAEGERIERVRVTAALGASTRVTYITASGREIVATQ
jgi:hypothetical protein